MDTAQRSKGGASRDAADIEQRARALVEAHSHFRGRSGQFEFACREKVLVVRGLVPTFYLKQVLQTVLKDLDGVRLVDNQVTVDSSGGFSDVRERVNGPIT